LGFVDCPASSELPAKVGIPEELRLRSTDPVRDVESGSRSIESTPRLLVILADVVQNLAIMR